MSMENKATEAKGKVKESTGSAVGNESLEAEGKADQSESKLKQGAEKVAGAVSDIKDGLKK
ncbi:MAG: CsbD family protein [Nocardioides sp.]|nr:CsbD family protein [Nocardioides sp.]